MLVTRGTALDQGVRSVKQGKYHIAWLNVLDRNLRQVVEVTCFLNTDEKGTLEASPFVDVVKGQDVEFPLRSIEVYKGVVSGGLAKAA